MVKMASFEISEKIAEVVDDVKDAAELRDDREFILSDSFEDFGFTSTDMV